MIVQLAFEWAARDFTANEANIEERIMTAPAVDITVSIEGVPLSFSGLLSYQPGPILPVTGLLLGPSSFSGGFNDPNASRPVGGSVTVTNFGALAVQVLPIVLVQVSRLTRLGGLEPFPPYWSTDQHLEGTLDSPAGSAPKLEVAFGRYVPPARLFDLLSADAIPGNITGVVSDDGGMPLAGAHVSIGTISPVRTDANGRYKLAAIHPGLVPVTVSDGIRFLPQTATVIVTPGKTTESDFALVNRNKLSRPAVTGK